MRNILITSFLFASLVSCNSQKTVSTSEPLPEIKIEDLLGSKYDCTKNASGKFKLCTANNTKSMDPTISFAIYEIESNKLVYNLSNIRKVKWESEFVIRVDNFNRIEPENESDKFYLFDVTTKKKIN